MPDTHTTTTPALRYWILPAAWVLVITRSGPNSDEVIYCTDKPNGLLDPDWQESRRLKQKELNNLKKKWSR